MLLKKKGLSPRRAFVQLPLLILISILLLAFAPHVLQLQQESPPASFSPTLQPPVIQAPPQGGFIDAANFGG